MHLESLLYMLLQSDKIISPPGVVPDFKAMADRAQLYAVPNEWIKVPARAISLGLTDPENESNSDRYFGWDNEKPPRSADVLAFEAKARALTNSDYAQYLKETQNSKIPASWLIVIDDRATAMQNSSPHNHVNGSTGINRHTEPLIDAFLHAKAVKTVFGPVPLVQALHWPVIASYDELEGCAKWMGGRIPTVEEVRSIYSHVKQIRSRNTSEILANQIPAVNG